MKKLYLVVLIVLAIVSYMNKSNRVIIPNESIRLRVIANSDSKEDQEIKYKVRDELYNELLNDIKESKNIEETRLIINSNLSKYKNLINNTLRISSSKDNFTITYGNNHFPKKEYKGVIYDEGDYESLVVTIGEGKGKNWWCCLFPPLCLIEADEKEDNKVEYKFFVKEILDKYLK